MQYIENRTFDEISVGDTAEMVRVLTARDIDLFAIMSGDVNPAHLDAEFARDDIFHKVIAHGMWGGALISAVLGTQLPGPGTIYLNQSLSFRRPVGLGDRIRVVVTVLEKDAETSRIKLGCACLNDEDKAVIKGEAEVIAPSKKIRRQRAHLPDVHLHHHGAAYSSLLAAAQAASTIRIAVICPTTPRSLNGAMDAFRQGLTLPTLIGPEEDIRDVADEIGVDLTGATIVNAASVKDAIQRAVEMVAAGEVDALDEGTARIRALVKGITPALSTAVSMSHAFALDVPGYPKPLIVTDGLLNTKPTLETKRDIIENALTLARALKVETPKVAILSAFEEITPTVSATLDAAALCKMAQRGQISGGVLDGPMAFDTAISKTVAKAFPGRPDVAGEADILVAPGLEAGNVIAKQLMHFAGAEIAGVLLGARVPVIVNGRADSTRSKVGAAALAVLLRQQQRQSLVS
ncbi:bifunctional enoyl-CoA hydratase/phosphate acetyltransferase [Shimia thalassica]|uniref:bifunctional enoyl-CoA hydratase/phosphate acetyltransferase n=1 Tax=Shimia thalassica TaxID=1715693 RepID=UPI000C08981C|nr:bifunctional enoyl-CoA hydratase/phosphate acetyltransferase [Shimia thalassica]MBU2941374.1 bifunctional enoyl-CoA hydratase/phosphate acetyltransferase [Shimia thalassica]MDO6503141.1 bifunctional enoyl-CoA hydratase/phosphate acetyltransferase [Shimia thalassica]MDO6798899.1 bifunctional enoyl-CoA hydratase/phosphate acetyltransferase [Shimia thalassica]PHO06001.1 enoyl-CoA hydratase [Rhodobacteraceae bacterium 4F10]